MSRLRRFSFASRPAWLPRISSGGLWPCGLLVAARTGSIPSRPGMDRVVQQHKPRCGEPEPIITHQSGERSVRDQRTAKPTGRPQAPAAQRGEQRRGTHPRMRGRKTRIPDALHPAFEGANKKTEEPRPGKSGPRPANRKAGVEAEDGLRPSMTPPRLREEKASGAWGHCYPASLSSHSSSAARQSRPSIMLRSGLQPCSGSGLAGLSLNGISNVIDTAPNRSAT